MLLFFFFLEVPPIFIPRPVIFSLRPHSRVFVLLRSIACAFTRSGEMPSHAAPRTKDGEPRRQIRKSTCSPFHFLGWKIQTCFISLCFNKYYKNKHKITHKSGLEPTMETLGYQTPNCFVFHLESLNPTWGDRHNQALHPFCVPKKMFESS